MPIFVVKSEEDDEKRQNHGRSEHKRFTMLSYIRHDIYTSVLCGAVLYVVFNTKTTQTHKQFTQSRLVAEQCFVNHFNMV